MTRKGPDEAIYAGSIVLSGDFQVETRRGFEEPRRDPRPRRPDRGEPPARHQDSHAQGREIRHPARRCRRCWPPGWVFLWVVLRQPWRSWIPTLPRVPAWRTRWKHSRPCRSATSRASWYATPRPSSGWRRPMSCSLTITPRSSRSNRKSPRCGSFRVIPSSRSCATPPRRCASWMTSAPGPCVRPVESRRIALLDRIPTRYDTDVTLIYKNQVIKVGNLGGQGPESKWFARVDGGLENRVIDSLMVGVNGQIAGLIDFRPSSRLVATAALHAAPRKEQEPPGYRSGIRDGRAAYPPARDPAGSRFSSRRSLCRRSRPADPELPRARAQSRLRRRVPGSRPRRPGSRRRDLDRRRRRREPRPQPRTDRLAPARYCPAGRAL